MVAAAVAVALVIAWATLTLLDRRRPVAATFVAVAAVTGAVAVWFTHTGM